MGALGRNGPRAEEARGAQVPFVPLPLQKKKKERETFFQHLNAVNFVFSVPIYKKTENQFGLCFPLIRYHCTWCGVGAILEQ